nr:hypothetical protein [Xenorhabdus beddingii]
MASAVCYRLDRIMSFMERGIVHDYHYVTRKLWQQILCHPRMKNIRINIPGKQAHGDEGLFDDRANDINTPFSMPIVCTETTPPFL